MQEHIESLTDKEDIVRGNKGSLLLVVILVLILAATASAWWCEPVGVRVAKAMVTRWGGHGRRDVRQGRRARIAVQQLTTKLNRVEQS